MFLFEGIFHQLIKHSPEKDDLFPRVILLLKLIPRQLLDFFLIKKKMVIEISPEVINKLALMYSAVVRHNILSLQKMEDGLLIYNVVFFVTHLKSSMGLLPLRF